VKNLFLLLNIIVFSASFKAHARLDFEDHAFPEFVTSSRALAMGNAFISKVDDSWSAFYNPAGLGTVRKPQFHLANIHLEASNGLLGAIGEDGTHKMPTNYIDSFDPEEMRNMLAKNKGELAHSRLNLFPNLTLRGMTLGYFYSQRNRAIINDIEPDPNDDANTLEIAERRDHGPIFALNASMFGGIFKIGASAAYVMRKELYASFKPTESINISGSDYSEGSSVQVNAGARLTLPYTYIPAFSVVLRNATNNDWEGTDDNGGPEDIKQTIDLGFSITPQISKVSRLHIEVNLKDLNNSYDTDSKRRLAAGMELDVARRFFIRAGYGDGWGSAGLGYRTRTINLDLTTYAVDRSQEDFREEEDRRWVFSLSTGF